MMSSKKYIHINTLKKKYSYYKINKMVETEELKKVNKRYYINLLFDGDEDDFYCVDVFISKGVICQLSAAVYYELTTYRPFTIDVAVIRNQKVYDLPDYPPMNPIYYSKLRYELGIVDIETKEGKYKIYDMEKTICDLLFYRNKIDKEIIKEVMNNYVKRSDKVINKLIVYAKQLRVYEILKTYFEVLL